MSDEKTAGDTPLEPDARDMAGRRAVRDRLERWRRSGRARGWREGAGVSQESAAIAVGVSVTTFRRWERGAQRPRGWAAAWGYYGQVLLWRRMVRNAQGAGAQRRYRARRHGDGDCQPSVDHGEGTAVPRR